MDNFSFPFFPARSEFASRVFLLHSFISHIYYHAVQILEKPSLFDATPNCQKIFERHRKSDLRGGGMGGGNDLRGEGGGKKRDPKAQSTI